MFEQVFSCPAFSRVFLKAPVDKVLEVKAVAGVNLRDGGVEDGKIDLLLVC
jgi:hypothetical protein